MDPWGLKSTYNKEKHEKGRDLQDSIDDQKEKDPAKMGIDQAPCPFYFGPVCDKAKDRTKDLIDKIRDRQKKECEIYKQCGLSCPYE